MSNREDLPCITSIETTVFFPDDRPEIVEAVANNIEIGEDTDVLRTGDAIVTTLHWDQDPAEVEDEVQRFTLAARAARVALEAGQDPAAWYDPDEGFLATLDGHPPMALNPDFHPALAAFYDSL